MDGTRSSNSTCLTDRSERRSQLDTRALYLEQHSNTHIQRLRIWVNTNICSFLAVRLWKCLQWSPGDTKEILPCQASRTSTEAGYRSRRSQLACPTLKNEQREIFLEDVKVLQSLLQEQYFLCVGRRSRRSSLFGNQELDKSDCLQWTPKSSILASAALLGGPILE
jgi:hypothetical protein